MLFAQDSSVGEEPAEAAEGHGQQRLQVVGIAAGRAMAVGTVGSEGKVDGLVALGGHGRVHLLQQLLLAPHALHVVLHNPLPIELCAGERSPVRVYHTLSGELPLHSFLCTAASCVVLPSPASSARSCQDQTWTLAFQLAPHV